MVNVSPSRTAALLKKLSSLRPELAMVLGSGFQEAGTEMEVVSAVAYRSLPGFPETTVAGHAGRLLIGWMAGVPVLVLSGRAHYYEGYGLDEVTFPVRVLAELGLRTVLLTSAAGGINQRYHRGDFMAFTDHINFMGVNPLRGDLSEDETRFVDLSVVYDRELLRLLKKAASQAAVRLHTGVYVAVAGPSYETPAEIRALARLGVDAVGMSTVPEAIVARRCGLEVAAVSLITNLAAGRAARPLSHKEVLETAGTVGHLAGRLLAEFVKLYGGRL